jgi:phage recombination protein Bet
MANNNELLAKPVEFEVNGEAVKLTGKTVKNFLVSGNGEVSDQEVVMFINLCKYQKLNPFLNEAYLVKFGQQAAQIIVSKEAFMKRAENHPKYEGFEAGIIVERDGQLVEVEGAVKLSNDKLVGGWAKIYRSDRKHPITARISLDEFSKGQATWKQMPLNMIRKSAIVNAQREAFPETLGALYTEDDAKLETAPSQEQVVEQEIKAKANQEVIDVDFDDVEDVKPEEEPTKEEMEQADIFDEGPGF